MLVGLKVIPEEIKTNQLDVYCSETNEEFVSYGPVAVIHHGLPGGEHSLLSLLSFGPLGVQQTVHRLGC